MRLWCDRCGIRLPEERDKYVKSRATGNTYCADLKACKKRVDAIRQREQHGEEG